VRAMAYDMARALVSAARKHDVGAFIFELARSEMEYTDQDCDEFATVMMAASIREGHRGPIFIQGDHYQANAKKYATDPDAVINGLTKLIGEAVAAGYSNIDIDTSTLVDLSFPTEREQQRANYDRCAELAAYIREREPEGVTISIGGEIGEVGKFNSTVAELRAFVEGFNEAFAKRAGAGVRGLSKISVNTGSSHGGVVLPDGSIAQVNIDFETLREMSAASREYGMGGAVQHGASTLPAEAFDKFPEVGTVEVHLATEFQNIMFDGGVFPDDLKQEMYAYAHAHLGDERGNDTEEQFIYKTRKKLWGPFKQQVWTLPEETRAGIRGQLEDKYGFLFEKLGVLGSRKLIERQIPDPRRIEKPQPEALKAVTA
jgi:fructose/tagatose bisphosphate aldolase